MSDKKILQIIKNIRESHPEAVTFYLFGYCYQFHLILKSIFETSEAYYNSDHVITKIGNKFYDITGEIKPKNHIPLKDYLNGNSNTDKWIKEIKDK